MQPYLLPTQNETDRGYLHPTAGAWQDLQATLNCLLQEPVTIGGDMLYLNSIGTEIELAACAQPSRGEPGEGGAPEGGGEDALCACEQSLYWATQAGFDCASEELIYFYHPDYLGSVEFVTDMRGEPYQFFLDTPWGENLENQFAKNYTSFSSRFRFNGKEWDEETGNYYYGARYYDPKISVWLSVDPMSSRDPGLTPYHYVKNNPVNLIDPTGLTWDTPKDKETADNARQSVGNTITSLENDNAKLNAEISKFESKSWSDDKKERKIGELNDRIQYNEDRIDQLNGTMSDIQSMEDSDINFRFSQSDNQINYVSTDENGTVVIPYSNVANLVHEIAHGGQVASGLMSPIPGSKFLSYTPGLFSPIQSEVAAYKRQCAFSPNSMPSSTAGPLNSLGSITPSWVRGIFINTTDVLGRTEKVFPYGKF